jgi:hypothetical protein
MATGALVVTALAAGASTHNQAQAARRAETRAKSVASQEVERQKKQEALIAAEEKATSQKVGARLRATAGRRAGRRSLISGAETGLGTKQELGG